HLDPLQELRRLVKIARDYHIEDRLEAAMMSQQVDSKEMERLGRLGMEHAEMMQREEGNPELLFWQAIGLTSADRLQDALPIFKRVFAIDPAWRDLVPRMVKAELLPNDEQVIGKIMQ